MNKDFMTLSDASKEELLEILDLADFYKNNRSEQTAYLDTQSIGMIFLKSSTRTRISFEVGIGELGGNALYLDKNSLQIKRGESLEDTAKALSCYLNGIIIRGYDHDEIVAFGQACDIPVINALTNEFHPCQLLADLQLLRWSYPNLSSFKLSFLGDVSSNMAKSWIKASGIFGFELVLGGPKQYWVDVPNKSKITFTEDAKEAVLQADFVYTDIWVSMGQEASRMQKVDQMQAYQVNSQLLSYAKESAKVMHCLPAHRGLEISQEVLDSPNCVIWKQCENRLHSQKALMTKLFRYRR